MRVKSRRPAREAALRALYGIDVGRAATEAALREALEHPVLAPELADYARELVQGVREHLAELDDRLAALVREWDFDRLAPVDRNVLRIGAFEIFHRNAIPPAVTINEAVEIAKKYSTAESGRFVNGVLGRLLKDSPKGNWDPSRAPQDVMEEEQAPPEEEPEEVTLGADELEAQEMARVGLWKLRSEDEGD
jgi:transcription antitermination protein NusB